MQDIREIELRDSGSNTNNKICFEIRALLYVPAFIQKDFYYVQTGPSTKGPLLRNYNSTPGVHYSSLNTQHLAKHKIKENTLGNHKDHKHSFGDIKGSQTIFPQNKDPNDRNITDSSSARKQSVLEKKKIKKTLGKTLDKI